MIKLTDAQILKLKELEPVREARDATGRTPKDYAIEFGEYLAKAAVFYMDTRNLADSANERGAEFDYDRLTDAFRALHSAVYEFRKRAERALAGEE